MIDTQTQIENEQNKSVGPSFTQSGCMDLGNCSELLSIYIYNKIHLSIISLSTLTHKDEFPPTGYEAQFASQAN
jgi:hypothetical protein